MEVANTLAYYGTATFTTVESFIVQALGVFFTFSHFYLTPLGLAQALLAKFRLGCK
jgi:hypothetical protein